MRSITGVFVEPPIGSSFRAVGSLDSCVETEATLVTFVSVVSHGRSRADWCHIHTLLLQHSAAAFARKIVGPLCTAAMPSRSNTTEWTDSDNDLDETWWSHQDDGWSHQDDEWPWARATSPDHNDETRQLLWNAPVSEPDPELPTMPTPRNGPVIENPDVQRPSTTPTNDPVIPVISNDPVIPVISTLTNDPVIPVISENSNRTIVPVVSRPLTRLPVFTPDAWAAKVTEITLPVWLPPSELRYHETRWLPHIGQRLMPWRLIGLIVWIMSDQGHSGVAQVKSTYIVGGHYDGDPLGRPEALEVLAIFGNPHDTLLDVWCRPMCANWIQDAPYPVWVIRWLC